MISLSSFMVSAGGLGFLPGGGTWATVCALTAFWLPGYVQVLLLCLICCVYGICVPGVLKKSDQKDPAYIVLDEIIAQLGLNIIVYAFGYSSLFLLLLTILFRFFDITKGLGIKRLESHSGLWGVLFDDLAAGGYALFFGGLVWHCLILLNVL